MKDSISDFIASWKRYDESEPSSETYWKNAVDTFSWHRRFAEAGYFPATLKSNSGIKWTDVVNWCDEQFGKGHFAATGVQTYWFETEEHAAWFTLKWG